MLLTTAPHTFGKGERLCSKKRIDQLFGSDHRSLSAYPLRCVYQLEERDGMPVEVLISVPKKLFKHAVDRNRLRRLVRESYRLNKHILWEALGERRLNLAFIWVGREIKDFATVESKMKNLLQRISEDMA